MPDDLYHRDILAWSEQQSTRLRRVAAGERVNDVDWANVIEEIESLGASELRAVQSMLSLALLHGLKVLAWPGHSARNHWMHEISNFLLQARQGFQPGMAQKLNAAEVYRRALRELRKMRMDGAPPGPVPDSCAVTPDDLLDEDFGADAMLARISPPEVPPAPG
jgi:hypothetical protein